ncbi:MAG: RHS repeat domain-containing protein [Candidatus Binatia bacterium]
MVTTNCAGTVLGQQGHYPFGESWYSVSNTTKWQFTSYERDAESGLDYAIFRYHSSRLGRFLTPDPLAGTIFNPQSLNRYSYVINNPTNLIDPLGLFIYFLGCERYLGTVGVDESREATIVEECRYYIDLNPIGGFGFERGGGGSPGPDFRGFPLSLLNPCNSCTANCQARYYADLGKCGVKAAGVEVGNMAIGAVAGLFSRYAGGSGVMQFDKEACVGESLDDRDSCLSQECDPLPNCDPIGPQ